LHSTKVIKCLVIMGIISLALGLLGVLVKVYEVFSDHEQTVAAQTNRVATKSQETTQNELKQQTDQSDLGQNSNESNPSNTLTMISAEDAAKIALSRINGYGRVNKVKLEDKEGISVYLVELEGKGFKAIIGVDPYTRKIVSAEIDRKHKEKDDD
jgi:uncharacterized membrane protein YkoI